ncbi:MAG: hypothetical protein M1839_001239 [Geoglossum umbratile]|nr:MAG: hypothetical protein M1839_001239 [Geoglossum umbratile]
MDTEIPFPRYMQLNCTPCPPPPQAAGSIIQQDGPYVPGAPSTPLTKPEVSAFLHRELSTPLLDELSPYLPFVARTQPDHIDGLNMQRVKGRKIVVAEKIELHLVWFYDVVYVKPIPECLLNWDFWRGWMVHCGGKCPAGLVVEDEKWCPLAAACGFLRSYVWLIQHRSDFRIAVETGLIPDGVNWPSFCRFIAQFRKIHNGDVSDRYQYGQLRLTRLNWAVRLVRPRSAKGMWNYQGMYWQTGQYVQRLLAPLMFGFVSAATVLSAMQVVVSIPGGRVMSSGGWLVFAEISWGFCVVMIALVIASWIALLGGISCVISAQMIFSYRQWRRKGIKSGSCNC